jgi:hypothetical protein
MRSNSEAFLFLFGHVVLFVLKPITSVLHGAFTVHVNRPY